MQEGSEPESFWTALGGRGDYPHAAPGAAATGGPLLFHLRDAAGRGLKVEAHTLFSQVRLNAVVCLLSGPFRSAP